MSKKNKRFIVTVQFDSQDFNVSAKHSREARRKIVERLKKIPAHRYMDKQNYFVTER